ncbi:hypothetical protein K439DRAFT_1401259 [Ramaria rubella]|nr:hypothetical protein K439DRAFT_1401259 [Ramaria rubella]
MLWRAGSGHRHFIHSISNKIFFFTHRYRCVSVLAYARKLPSPTTPPSPQLSPEVTQNPQFTFTGKISRRLLSKFPKETAAFISVIEELFVANASREIILNRLQTIPSESNLLSNAKRVSAFAQTLVLEGFPERAMHVLYIARQMRTPLPHNQYEQVAFQLATANQWRYVQITTTMARKFTGSWTVRLLNWALRSYIETQNYGLLDPAFSQFALHQLKPTRRTYHLLVEGHLRNSNLASARVCLTQMQSAGIDMNRSTYAVVLNAYRSLGPNRAIETQAFHTLQGTGELSNTMILNGLMKMRIDDGDIPGALRVLRLIHLPQPQNHKGDGNNGDGGKGNEASATPGPTTSEPFPSVVPDSATFNILLMLLSQQQGEMHNVIAVFRQMAAAGLQADAETAIALISAYSTGNMTGHALTLVYEMCKNNNIFVDRNEFRLLGRLTDTIDVQLQEILSVCPTVDVFNALLRAVLPKNGIAGLRRVLRIMRQSSILPDASTTQIIITYLHNVHYMNPKSLISVLQILSAFPVYEASITVQHLNVILRSLLRREIDAIRTHSWNASAQRVRFGHSSRILSQRLSNTARIFDPTAGISVDSFQVRISKLFEPIIQTLVERQVMSDRMTFALRIRRDAVVRLDIKSAQRVFDVMVARGIRPNAYHYSALIEGYAALGNMSQAQDVMERASRAGIKPNVIMYTILIKGFAKLGQPDLAKQVFSTMAATGVKPDFAAVDAVVSAYWFVGAYQSARALLLDLWPLVAPFPLQLQDAPLRVLVQHLRRYRGKPKLMAVRPIESRCERYRRTAVQRRVKRTLTDLERWQEVLESVSWAQADIGLRYMLQADTSSTGREYDWF